MDTIEHTPRGIKVIGWGAIACGALLLLTWLVNLATAYLFYREALPKMGAGNDPMAALAAMPMGMGIDWLLAIGIAVTGFNLLRRKPWARVAMLVLAWLTLALVVLSIGFWALLSSDGILYQAAESGWALAALLGTTLIFCAAPAWAIFYLNSATARAAMKSGA